MTPTLERPLSGAEPDDALSPVSEPDTGSDASRGADAAAPVAPSATSSAPESAPAEAPRVYAFEATTKRVAASGDSFQVVLEMSGQDWLKYVSAGLHKGVNTVLVRPPQQQLWEPPADAGPGPQATGECFYDEALQAYQCRERPHAASQEPCAHILARTAAEAGETAQLVESDPGYAFAGRRSINGQVVDGENPCANPACGKKARKDGTHAGPCTEIAELDTEIRF